MPMFFLKPFALLVFLSNLSSAQTTAPTQNKKVKMAQTTTEKGYYQFFGGAITYHFFDFKGDSHKFKKNIGDKGKLISHPFFGVEKAIQNGSDIDSRAMFIFNDSLGSIAYGYQNSSSVKLNSYAEAGYFWSFYFIRNGVWEKNEVTLPVRIKLGRSVAVVPVVGLVQTFNFNIYKDYDVKLNFAITPNTATTLIGIKKPF